LLLGLDVLRRAIPVRDAGAGDLRILGLALDADEAPARGALGIVVLAGHRAAGCARAGEGIEDHGTRRRDQAAEIAHQLYRLDGGVDVASLALGALGLES